MVFLLFGISDNTDPSLVVCLLFQRKLSDKLYVMRKNVSLAETFWFLSMIVLAKMPSDVPVFGLLCKV